MQNMKIELTKDMAQTIADYFDAFKDGDTIQIISNEMGLWFVVPGSRRPKFIGKAKLNNLPLSIACARH